MKLLVTGAGGQIGREMVSAARAEGMSVIGSEREALDITMPDELVDALQAHRPQWVVNVAAHTDVDGAEEDRAQSSAINTSGPMKLAIACQEAGVKFLHLSTDYIFSGEPGEGGFREDDAPNPLNVYGKSKLAGEESVRKHCQSHIILRTAWAFGAHGNNFVKTMLKVAKQGAPLSVVNDQLGCPTPAKAIARAVAEIVQKADANTFGTYHFAGAPPVTWYGFAQEIFRQCEELGLQTPPSLTAVTTEQYPRPAKRPANSVLNCEKIRATFGIEAPDWRIHLEELLQEIAA